MEFGIWANIARSTLNTPPLNFQVLPCNQWLKFSEASIWIRCVGKNSHCVFGLTPALLFGFNLIPWPSCCRGKPKRKQSSIFPNTEPVLRTSVLAATRRSAVKRGKSFRRSDHWTGPKMKTAAQKQFNGPLLTALLGKKVFFNGKFDRGEEDRFARHGRSPERHREHRSRFSCELSRLTRPEPGKNRSEEDHFAQRKGGSGPAGRKDRLS